MNKMPRISSWLLKIVVPCYDRELFLADVEEVYRSFLAEKGRLYAFFWLWFQIFKTVPSFFHNRFIRSFSMLRNYMKITLRNLIKQKGYSLINITGLAIGIAVSIFLIQFISYELSYDTLHENADNIYRLNLENWAGSNCESGSTFLDNNSDKKYLVNMYLFTFIAIFSH